MLLPPVWVGLHNLKHTRAQLQLQEQGGDGRWEREGWNAKKEEIMDSSCTELSAHECIKNPGSDDIENHNDCLQL